MPPELLSAIIGALISAFVAIGAAATLLPPFLKGRMETWQKTQDSKIAIEQKKSDESLEESKQERLRLEERDKQFIRLVDSLISERATASVERAANQQQQEVMVRALTSAVAVLDGMAKELRANTGVTTDTSKTMIELAKSLDELLEKGSQPLQTLSRKVDEMGAGVAAMVLNQRDMTDKVNYIHGKIEQITELKNYLDVMLKVAEAKLEDAKKGTDELPKVIPSINPSST